MGGEIYACQAREKARRGLYCREQTREGGEEKRRGEGIQGVKDGGGVNPLRLSHGRWADVLAKPRQPMASRERPPP